MDLLFMIEGSRFTLYSVLTSNGVPAFLEGLKEKDRPEFDRMIRRLEQLSNRGPSRRRDEFNYLGEDLYEAKTNGGARVVFFYDRNSIVICAAGFSKKSRKTPTRVLEAARSRKNLYEKQKKTKQTFLIHVPEGGKKPERQP